MTYSRTVIVNRIKALLPARWFGEDTPILDSVLNPLATGWLRLFDLLDYARMQTRITTAFDTWLDLIARDYFGHRITRRRWESDTSFRYRIKIELLRDRCTRLSIFNLLQDLTGRTPMIFEPTNPQDTGCYGSLAGAESGHAGYGASGGWGSLKLPFQVFVRALRPSAEGIATINGWRGSTGGYGIGFSAYADLAMHSSQMLDSEMCRNISRVAPAGTIVWTAIEP